MKLYARQNSVVELSFASPQVCRDPYNEVTLDGVVTAPGGGVTRVPAFWAGEDVWKLRFAGTELGEYRVELDGEDGSDAGLSGRQATIFVEAYEGSNPLLRHGRIRVAADRRHFEHADGTPFFWTGDTWWMGLSTRLDWPRGFRALTADRVAKGFNTIQIVAGPYPDMDAWDPRGRNEAGFPFKEGFHAINPAYYDHADLKIGHLVHSGLMPCIVGMWGYYLPQIGIDRVKRFWRYLVARYGAYPVVWCVCGEGAMPWYLSETKEEDAAVQKRGWTEVMACLRGIDGYRNLITIHPTQYGRDQVEDPALMDFEMLQTGHDDIESVPNTIATVRTAMQREPAIPVINSEVNYEGILGRCWQNIQRLCFYHSVLNGAAGYTYGANGIWQMSTRENPYGPSPHGNCWGNTPWDEAAQLPGSRQAGLGAAFLRRLPWWQLERHPEWAAAPSDENDPYGIVAVGIPGKLRLLYVPLCWGAPTVKGIEAGATYRARYFDPCTGEEVDLGAVSPDGQGEWTPPPPPEVHDWILLMESVQGGPATPSLRP